MAHSELQAATVKCTEFLSFTLGDELVLWPPGSARLFVLNASAQVIWRGQAAGLPASAIAQQLAHQFAVPLAQAEHDTQAALAAWQHASVLNPVGMEAATEPALDAPQERLPVLPPPRAEHVYRLAGLSLRVRYREATLHRILQPLLHPLEVAADTAADTVFELSLDAKGAYLLGQDGALLIRSHRRDDVVTHALYHLSTYPCRQAPALAVLHAAAVAVEKGCLLLAAPGGRGKTTLTAALLAQGLDYLGDDLIVLSRDEPPRAWPVPGPLCLKAGSWSVLKAYYPDLDTLPILQRRDQPVRYLPPPRVTAEQAWPIRGLLFPTYQPARSVQLESLSPSAALQGLMAANSQLRQPLNAQEIGVFIGWLNRTPAYRLVYAALADAVAAVRRLSGVN